jgi:hypothetical protein
MILRGMAHVHSRWSYDGCHDLDQIVGWAHARGLHKRLNGWLARRGLRAPASLAGAARRLLK